MSRRPSSKPARAKLDPATLRWASRRLYKMAAESEKTARALARERHYGKAFAEQMDANALSQAGGVLSHEADWLASSGTTIHGDGVRAEKSAKGGGR